MKEVILLTDSSLTIAEKYPEESRPRERLWNYGSKALSDHELLAIILRTGTKNKNVVDLALEVISTFGSLYYLKNASLEELTSISGIGKAKAIEIQAVVELGERISLSSLEKIGVIQSSEQTGRQLVKLMHGLEQEHVIALYLNTKNEIIKQETVFIGSLNSSIAHPREIFKGAVKYSAARIIIAHNHPSGNPEPSQADYEFTTRMIELGDLMGIELLDHFIIGDKDYISLREHAWI